MLWPRLTPFLLSMLNKSMLNSMLPITMLSSCRCYSFDVNFFEVDVPVVDVSYFPQPKGFKRFLPVLLLNWFFYSYSFMSHRIYVFSNQFTKVFLLGRKSEVLAGCADRGNQGSGARIRRRRSFSTFTRFRSYMFPRYIHIVPRIVALITVRGNTGLCAYVIFCSSSLILMFVP